MAKYRITAPDGSKYEITAPDHATEQDVMSYAQEQFGKPATPAAPAAAPVAAPTLPEPTQLPEGPIQSRLAKQRLKPGQKEIEPLPAAEFPQRIDDVARLAAHGVTVQHSDRIAAGVASLFGGDYEKTKAEQRAAINAARERLGKGAAAAEIGGSLVPAIGVGKAISAAVGPVGNGVAQAVAHGVKNVVAQGVAGGVQGGIHARGEDKSVPMGMAVGGALGAGLPAGIGVARGGAHVIGDVANRKGGALRSAEKPATEYTTRRAAKYIADAAEQGGMRTEADLLAGVSKNAVPNLTPKKPTPSALVNSGNDRVLAQAVENAAKVNNPAPAKIAAAGKPNAGQVERTNVIDEMIAAQHLEGTAQANALRNRFYDDLGVPAVGRNPTYGQQAAQSAIDKATEKIKTIRAAGGNTTTPGLRKLLDANSDARKLYHQAVSDASIPGATGHIPANLIPAVNRVNNRNVPIGIAQDVDQAASAMAREGPVAADRRTGVRLMEAFRDIAGANPRSKLSQTVRQRETIHGLKTRLEDQAAGRALPTAGAAASDTAVVDFNRLVPGRQANQRLGYAHGVADRINDNASNLSALGKTFLSNPTSQRAYMTMLNPKTMTPAQMRTETTNIGNMQDVGQQLRSISHGRSADVEGPADKALRIAGKYQFSHTAGVADLWRWALHGQTQARRSEMLRLHTDTSGQGLKYVGEELERRAAMAKTYPKLAPILMNQAIAAATARLASGGN